MIGTTVSHYKILEKIGEGGMAQVYKAEDTKLKRTVALKFITPDKLEREGTKTRFVQEAQAAASLNHPNITTIYEIDEAGEKTFISMEYIEGTNLGDIISPRPLSLGKSLNFALQIADGIREAHEQGITHRDIKSSNIMITAKGQAKIMDFGLVKLEGATQITKTKLVMGTVSFMSPEQAGGEAVDHRTDIWSFGVVLYEMLTGRLPFQGAHDQVILYSILKRKHKPLSTLREDAPPLLEDIINTCLKKNPNDRYQSMADLIADLERLKRDISTDHATLSLPGKWIPKIYKKPRIRIVVPLAAVILFCLGLMLFTPLPQILRDWIEPKPKSVEQGLAIIPFTILGGAPGDAELCAGLVEVITSKLTQVQPYQNVFWVVPSTEVRRENIQSAGDARKAFHVGFVLAMTMQIIDSRTNLIINLIDAETLRQLQSKILSYETVRPALLQDELIEESLSMLGIDLPPPAQVKIAEGKTDNQDAWNLYIQGLGYLQRYERAENIEIAIDLFQRSIEKDPNYALACAGLGEAFWRKWDNTKDKKSLVDAQSWCERALQFSEDLAPVHITLGIIHRTTGKYEEAISELTTALSIEPENAQAHRELGRVHLALGDLVQAEDSYRTAIEKLPHYWGGYSHLGAFYYSTGQADQAIQMFRKVIELTPDNPRGYSNLGGIYVWQGMYDRAVPVLKKSIDINPDFRAYNNLATAHFNLKDYEAAQRIYEKIIESGVNTHKIWGNLGDTRRYTGLHTTAQIREAYLEAIALAADALEINVKDSEARSFLAYYCAVLGDTERALKEILRVQAQNPKDLEVLRKVVQVYDFIGDLDRTITALENYLKNGGSLNYILEDPDLKKLQQHPEVDKLRQDFEG